MAVRSRARRRDQDLAESFLHLAAEKDQIKVIKVLIEHCPIKNEVLTATKPGNLETPLHCGAFYNEIVISLLAVNPKLACAHDKSNTVLHKAVRYGDCELIEYLLSLYPEAASVLNSGSMSPLGLLVRSHNSGTDRFGKPFNFAIMKLLMQKMSFDELASFSSLAGVTQIRILRYLSKFVRRSLQETLLPKDLMEIVCEYVDYFLKRKSSKHKE